MKQCTKCLVSKETSDFSLNCKYADGVEYWCQICWKNYRKSYRESNLGKARQSTNERRALRVQWLQDLKSNIPCIDCNQVYEPFCMDYDHVPGRGTKIKSISRMVMDNTPKKIIIAEIAKCDLVCLLCHNKRTYNRFNETLGENRTYRSHVQRNIHIINEFKNTSCTICNIQYENYNMQIDHIDPSEKLYNVCQLKSCKISILQTELAKCQVLCALCHRRKSITEQQDKKYSHPRQKPPKRQKLFYDSVSHTKECGRCHQIKTASEFRSSKITSSGLDTYCKVCFSEYKREKRKIISKVAI